MNQLTLIHQIRIPLLLINLLLPLPLRILFRSSIRKPLLLIPPLRRTLLRNTTPHIRQIRWIPRLDDVISRQNTTRSYEPQTLTEFKIARVRGLVVVEEHEVDFGDCPVGVEAG